MRKEYNFSNTRLSTKKVIENKADKVLSGNLHSHGGGGSREEIASEAQTY